jgi:type I restriction-modification system DNA methylase subunit
MSELETKQHIERTLKRFSQGNLRENGLALLNALGYHSDRQVILDPNTFAGFAEIPQSLEKFNREKALVDAWVSVDILFQLTGDDIREVAQGKFIFEKGHRVDNQIIESYLFLAIELKPFEYSRSKLAEVTREINKLFAMPVMILFKCGDSLTLSLINRRLHKREESKDVLEKVTLIRGINLKQPLRAHTEILFDLSLDQLQNSAHFHNFVELHNAWQKTLDTSELNKKFFREVANWYFWAVQNVTFPEGGEPDEEKRNSTNVIRLITRLIFVWFIKEKGVMPESLFDLRELEKILNYNDPHNSTYYKAILQNLFFATLNIEMGKERRFRGKNPNGLDAHYGIWTVYRYEKYFKNPRAALQLFAGIPFLNGGLFECLDKREQGQPHVFVDGFSDTPKNQPTVPDELFFGVEQTVDLNETYGDKRHGREKVRGLIHIFNSYKFTIEENTPLEEEIALDPELLGKVFENLLAVYNPETGTTARKQTGSFYTPREIVNYMVDEALIAYLASKLNSREDAESSLRHLLTYNQEPHQFTEIEEQILISAIDEIKVLDPACGSGAYPMGVLHKLVFILNKLDPGNVRWKERQLAKASEIPDSTVRERVLEDIEKSFNENELDYGRKLYLIENCIYGVDIQPIAVQIAKLRFFISLVVEQRTNPAKPNLGIRPLPNLETKFVAANTLVAIERPHQLMFRNPLIEQKEKQLTDTREALFTARTPATKRKYRELDKKLRTGIAALLKTDGWGSAVAAQLAGWDPYDQNASAEFFDPEWMFGLAEGFDIAIGNPPYVQLQSMGERADALKRLGYETFARTGDIYCLFYERGFQLLRPKGILAYITSNKWMRAGYGEVLRKYFADHTNPLLLIDFSGQKIFESATVDVSILVAEKSSNQSQTRGCVILDKGSLNNLGAYIEQHSTYNRFSVPQSWSILSNIEQRIKSKIQEVGIPLKNWDIHINYGIKTGLNEAFIISGKKKNELIDLDPKSAEIIRPILRGRDIKRYGYQFADLYLICTFPSRNYDIEYFPAIKNHLLSFGYERLEQSGKSYIINGERISARKKTNNKWFETQDSIGYWDDFYKQKIIYPDIMRMPRQAESLKEYPYFYLDEENFFAEATNFIMTGQDIDLVYLFLASELGFFAFSKFYSGPQFDETGFRYKKAYLDNTFIPSLNSQKISVLRDTLKTLKESKDIDDEINVIWTKVVGLNTEEAKYVSRYKRGLLDHGIDESNLIR